MRKEYDFSKARRGPVIPTPAGKTRITIRLDDDVINWFRNRVADAGGGSYQTLINNALRDYIQRATDPLEEVLRRVVRQEIREAVAAYNDRVDSEGVFSDSVRKF